MGKADRDTPWTIIGTPRQIVNLARRVIGNFVVIFHLVGDLGHTGPGHRPHVVIPPINPFTGLAIIGGPAEISGINIGGQTLFEPVQLVWSDKMHLARQTGVIPRAAQMVGIGGN